MNVKLSQNNFFLFCFKTKLIVVSSLFSLKLITETDQWQLKIMTCPRLCSNIRFTTTCKQFEPGHNLITFLLVHSAPLNTIVPIMETTSTLVVERLTLIE